MLRTGGHWHVGPGHVCSTDRVWYLDGCLDAEADALPSCRLPDDHWRVWNCLLLLRWWWVLVVIGSPAVLSQHTLDVICEEVFGSCLDGLEVEPTRRDPNHYRCRLHEPPHTVSCYSLLSLPVATMMPRPRLAVAPADPGPRPLQVSSAGVAPCCPSVSPHTRPACCWLAPPHPVPSPTVLCMHVAPACRPGAGRRSGPRRAGCSPARCPSSSSTSSTPVRTPCVVECCTTAAMLQATPRHGAVQQWPLVVHAVAPLPRSLPPRPRIPAHSIQPGSLPLTLVRLKVQARGFNMKVLRPLC